MYITTYKYLRFNYGLKMHIFQNCLLLKKLFFIKSLSNLEQLTRFSDSTFFTCEIEITT